MSLRDRNINNQERGAKGESLITDSLRSLGLWNHKLENAGYGTLFDKIIIPPGGGYGVEIKTRKEPRIAYNKSSITINERKGLDKFMNLVGKSNALIIGIWDNGETRRAFIIPWYQVREDVISGRPGSIKMLDFPELRKIPGGWDFSCFKNIGGDNV